MMKYFVGMLRHKMVRSPQEICNNYTTVYSCVPGPKKSWTFDGLRVKEVFYLVPGVGALGCGIGVITQGDYCQATIGCDIAYFPNDSHKDFI